MALNGLRLAIGQVRMHWEGDDNTQAVVDGIAFAAAAGCDVALFSELALTGYHRRIREMAQPVRVDGWLQRVREACAAHGVAAGVGLPTFGDAGQVFNSYAFVDEQGRVAGIVEKTGLTEAEATFMARGAARPVLPLRGLGWSAVLCREVEDGPDVLADFAAVKPGLIVWPGLIGPEDDQPVQDPPRHVQQAQAIARVTGAWFVQVNWPNGVNHPELNHRAGRSVVIAPDGAIAFHLPPSAPGIGVFTLGATAFDWHPEPG